MKTFTRIFAQELKAIGWIHLRALKAFAPICLAILALVAMTGCPNSGGYTGPVHIANGGGTPQQTPDSPNQPTIRPIDDGNNQQPTGEGEGETEQPPATDTTGSIVISGILFQGLGAKSAEVKENTPQLALTTEELAQAFLEVAKATDGLAVELKRASDNASVFQGKATVKPDGSFSLAIDNIVPADYVLSVETASSTTGIAGWSGNAPVKVEAGKRTPVTLTLKRATTFFVGGSLIGLPGNYDADPTSGAWTKATVALNDAAGHVWAAKGESNSALGTFGFGCAIAPVEGIFTSVDVTDDDGNTYRLSIKTDDLSMADGYTIFDKIDGTALQAEYAGGIDITIPPIDPTDPVQPTLSIKLQSGNVLYQSHTENESAIESIMMTQLNFSGSSTIVSGTIEILLGGTHLSLWKPADASLHMTPSVGGITVKFMEPLALLPMLVDVYADIKDTPLGETKLSFGNCHFYDADGNEVAVQLVDSDKVTVVPPAHPLNPTITFKAADADGRIPVEVKLPFGHQIGEYLVTDLGLGDTKYLGVAGPQGWSWNPATSPSGSDVVVFDNASQDKATLSTSYESGHPNHFRGNLFVVNSVDGMDFFDLTQWDVVIEGSTTDPVIDDGNGGLIIDFTAAS